MPVLWVLVLWCWRLGAGDFGIGALLLAPLCWCFGAGASVLVPWCWRLGVGALVLVNRCLWLCRVASHHHPHTDRFAVCNLVRFVVLMMGFSKPRLEGRALEHGLSRDASTSIRMKDAPCVSTYIVGERAKQIREYMRTRADGVVKAMALQGLFRIGADSHVRIRSGSVWVDESVDFRVRVPAKNTEVSVGVKWSRKPLDGSSADADEPSPWLRQAASGGRWAAPRRPVVATAVGTLLVGPGE